MRKSETATVVTTAAILVAVVIIVAAAEMPLLRKQPFQRLHVSSDFRDDDEVYLCEVTNEIFKDYK